MNEKAVKKKALRPGGDPKNDNQERDKQKNLEETERNGWKRCIPGQRNAGRVNRADCEKDEGGKT